MSLFVSICLYFMQQFACAVAIYLARGVMAPATIACGPDFKFNPLAMAAAATAQACICLCVILTCSMSHALCCVNQPCSVAAAVTLWKAAGNLTSSPLAMTAAATAQARACQF
jgi:hypothetical protein